MAEAFTVIGLASSIVTFVDVSTKVLARLREFHSIAKETPRVFRHITTQLPLLIDIMRRIERGRAEGSFSADAQCALSRIVEGSLSQITMLDGLIKKILPTSTDSTLQRGWKAIASVRKEKDVASEVRSSRFCEYSGKIAKIRRETASMHQQNMKILYASWLKPLGDCFPYQTKLQGTCDWIWSEPTFMIWNEPSSLSGSDRLLCIYGTHGCGKSVLASSIVKGLKSKQQQTLFFSFSGTDGKRQTVDSLVRTILWQLLEETTDQQCSEIMNDLMLRGPSATPRLLNAFEQTAKLMTGSVYCIIDGVDECIDECDGSTRGLVKHVLDLLNSLANFHVVLLGRPYALQAAIRATSLKIEMNSDLIKQDIKTFIYAKIESSPNLRIPELQDFVFKALQEKSDGMFLWVKLMIDDLRKSATQFEVMERLRNLPRGLERAYRLLFLRLVGKLDNLELIRARKVLALTIASCRALRIDELRYAYALDSRSGSTFEEHLFLQPDQGILDVCGDLINIRGGLVQLIHTSVKEFLTRPEEKWLCGDDREIACFRVDLETTHRSLGCICIDYLGMNEFGFPLHNPDAFSMLGTQYPFLEYASRHAIPHLMRSGPPCSMITDKINDFFESGKFAHWAEYLAMLWVDDPSNSILADEFHIFESWLNKGNHLCEPFEDKVRMSWRQELAKRTRKFGEDDLRTERWRNLLDLTDYAEPNPDPEVASIVFRKDPKESSDAVSQILNLLNNHTILPLPRQVDMILKLQSHLRRVKILNDPLRMLFGVILRVADKIPVHVLLVIGMFYDRLDKLEDALKVYYAALTKVENQEAHIKFVILQNIGDALYDQGKDEAAEEIYRRAVEGREKVLGKEHALTLDSAIGLGNTLYNQGKYEAAEEIYRRAVEGREKVLGKEHTLTLDSAIGLGNMLYSQGKHKAAEEIYRRVVEGREKVLGKEHTLTLDSVIDVGDALYSQRKHKAAEEIYRRAIDGREKVLGKEHAETLDSVNRLGNTIYGQGKYEAAEEIYRRAVEGGEKVLGKEHALTLDSAIGLGNTLYNQGKYEAAEEIYRRAVEGREKVLGKEHTLTLDSVIDVGDALYSQRKHEAAEEIYRRAIDGREKVLGKEHAETLDSVNRLGNTIYGQGKYEAAEEIYRRAIEGWEKVLGKEHIKTLDNVSGLGNALCGQGKYEAAEEIYRRAIEGREKVLGKEHTQTLDSVNKLGNTLYYQGKDGVAEEMYRWAIEGREKVLGKEHAQTLDSVNGLGNALYSQGKDEAAEEIYRRAVEGREKVLGKEHTLTLDSAIGLGDVLYSQGKHKAAEEMYRRAIEGLEKVLGKEHALTLDSAIGLGDALCNQCKHKAEEMYRRAVEGKEKALGKEHAQTLNSVDIRRQTASTT
ncbi:hypothetical protein V2W45_1343896 [Cenococcum geophilum]